jgi:hypothetical protein
MPAAAGLMRKFSAGIGSSDTAAADVLLVPSNRRKHQTTTLRVQVGPLVGRHQGCTVSSEQRRTSQGSSSRDTALILAAEGGMLHVDMLLRGANATTLDIALSFTRSPCGCDPCPRARCLAACGT